MKEISLSDSVGSTGLFTDGDWVESKDQDPNGEVRLIQLADIGVGAFLDRSARFLTMETAKRLRCTFLKPGDILIARMPDPIGRACIFPGLSQPCATVVDVCVLRPDSRILDANYAKWMINSPRFLKKIEGFVSGSTRQRISRGNLAPLSIPLPPLEEQKRIAAILDQADELRRKRQRALDRLNQLGQAIFVEMFGDFDGGSAPVARLGALTSKIGSGATPKGGDSAYKTEGTPLIRSMNVRDGEFSEKGLVFLDDQQATKLNNVIIQANDVLLNITGASVARVCLAPPHMEGARVNQHVSIIRPSKSITSEFLEAFLLIPRTKRILLTIAEAGATRQAITKAQIEELEVPVPELGRQRKFIERLRLARQSTVAMVSQSTALEAMFASLQHRAFCGEL